MTEGAQPAWAWVQGEWIYASGLILALVLPLVRAAVRWLRDPAQQCFVTGYVIHDVAAGLSLPSFLALCLTSVAPTLLNRVDRHTLTLAGLLGIIFILREVFGPDHAIRPGNNGGNAT